MKNVEAGAGSNRVGALCRALLPPGRPFRAPRRLLPEGRFEWLAFGVLLLVFGLYGAAWVRGHWGMLTDPALQTDDARTALYPFHRYAAVPLLEHDAVADEMIGFTPPALRGLYFVAVRASGLHTGIKIVQAVAFLLILLAGAYLIAQRRSGWAAGLLLVFFILHSRGLVGGTVGGMTRGFVVPVLALWIAGVLAGSERMRYGATLVAALTHPSVMALLLATEGILATTAGVRGGGLRLTGRRLLRFAVLAILCVGMVLPFSLDQSRRVGRTHTFEEAVQEGVLGPSGRAKHLPFGDPTGSAASRFIQPFVIDEKAGATGPDLTMGKPLPAVFEANKRLDNTGALVFVSLLIVLALARLAPMPRAIVAIVAASFIMYLLARLLAFRLYAPERIYQYGMPAAGLMIAVGPLGHLLPRLRRATRATVRNVAAAAVIVLSVAATGDGIVPKNGVSLDRRTGQALYDVVATLPKDVLIASHPNDGDDIPLWCGRSTVCGFETLQPWWVGHWQRGKGRAMDTLAALYATDRAAVLDYCRRYGVTHLLLRTDRYGADFKKRATVFEPLGAFVRELLERVGREDLALGTLPDSAVICRMRSYRLVDVLALEAAWRQDPEIGRARKEDR